MQARTAIFLVLLSLPAAAAEVSREVPAQFLGDWCTEYLPHEEDTGESDIRIGTHEIGYYRDSGKILAVAAVGAQLALVVQLAEDGRTWLATHDFELSDDGRRLTSQRTDGQLQTRTRCRLSPAAPHDSSRPTPLRDSSYKGADILG